MTESLEGGSSGPQYTVPGILHYLQHEFTTYEVDRIRWEDERAALKAQISFLQGEREGHQNMMQCLVKRIKMLENALRQERLGKSEGPKVNGEMGCSEMFGEDEVDGYLDPPKPPVNEQVKKGRLLLKQYLTEVGSTEQLLNARTARLQIMQSLANSDMMPTFHKAPVTDQSTSPGPDDRLIDRTRNNNQVSDYSGSKRMMYHEQNDTNVVTIIDDEEDSSDDEKEGDSQAEDALRAFDFMDDEEEDEDDDEDQDMEDDGDDEDDPSSFSNQMLNHKDSSIPRGMKGLSSWNNYDSLDMYSRNGKRFNRKGPNMRINYDDEEPSPIPNQLPKGTDNIPSGLKVSTKSNKDFKDIDFLQTKEQKADNNDDSLFSQMSLGELAGIQVSDMESSYDNFSLNQSNKFWWQLKCSMRAHFDSVRQLTFSPDRPLLFTASDDCTLRMWDVEALNLYKKGGPDVEPLYTFRGHSAPVLCCSCANSENEILLFSGSADSTVRYWRLPAGADINIYDPYDGLVEEGELRGHEEAVWGITSHPTSLQTVSCGADGITCVWDISLPNPLVTTFTSEDGAPATCVDYVRSDPESSMIAVGYVSSVIIIYNIPETRILSTLTCEPGATNESVNSLASHPSNGTVIAGYSDKEIRIFDVNSGELLHHMTTHIEAVTSVTIDPSGVYLATVGHDCSLRIWNIEDKSCTQEMTAHQKKFDEAILTVAFHPSQTFIATGGSDSTIKLYQ
ncbi:striatin-3-like isoform X2 [Bolinopsis microptera]|uniref:striatin-3-like isoform X2 n=1 Tax=Bolinopsis microptera TaxID=2820187 RepID=UPI003079FB4A